MKNTKAKFDLLSNVLVDETTESQAEPRKAQNAPSTVKTDSQKAVKTASKPARGRMHLAKPANTSETAGRGERAEVRVEEEEGGEPRRQMTVKLPLSLYARLSEEKSRRVVTNNKSWSIQDIITEALERHLRAH